MLEGYIYIIENPDSRLGLLKIGKTSRSVKERLNELNNTSIGEDLVLIKKFHVEQVDRVEKIIHKKLEFCRHNKEWFQIDKDAAIFLVDDICSKYSSTYLNLKKRAIDLWWSLKKHPNEENYWLLPDLVNDIRRGHPGMISEIEKEIGEKII